MLFPQQITWLYANDLTAGASFFSNILKLKEVASLIQHDKCLVFLWRADGSSGCCFRWW